MNKDILDDEIEFPDDIISFLKVKYPKAHTDQEKAVLKQIEQLTEEKKELKEIISKKREQAKLKSLPINIIPSEEAKEKAIKSVQDGTLLLSSKTKSIDLEDSLSDNQHANAFSQKNKSKSIDDTKKSECINSSKNSAGSKISFISAGYAFSESQSKPVEESQNLKRSLSINSSAPDQSLKKIRQTNDESSESEDQDKSNFEKVTENRSNNTSVLRFCGHNMNEEFVRRIIEPYGDVISLSVEERHDNSTNVVVSLENSEVARTAKEALDSQFIEGRVVNVYFKRGSSEFSQRRPFRRRRGRGIFLDTENYCQLNFIDFGRVRGRYQRNDSFPPMENDQVLPSHFYNAGGENDNFNKKTRFNVSESEGIDQANGAEIIHTTLRPNSDRDVVIYDDLN